MNQIFLKIYYSLLFFYSFKAVDRIINLDVIQSQFSKFSEMHSLIPSRSAYFDTLILCCLAFVFINIFKSHKLLRCGAAFGINYLYYAWFSAFGSTVNMMLIWLISSIVFIFFDEEEAISSEKNKGIIALLQTITLSHYFIAGLWKLRSLMEDFSVTFFKAGVLENYAYSVAEGKVGLRLVTTFLIEDAKFLLYLGMGVVLFFQLSTLYPVLTRKHLKVFGALCLVFHTTVLIFTGIPFYDMALASIFFLYVVEKMKEIESGNKLVGL